MANDRSDKSVDDVITSEETSETTSQETSQENKKEVNHFKAQREAHKAEIEELKENFESEKQKYIQKKNAEIEELKKIIDAKENNDFEEIINDLKKQNESLKEKTSQLEQNISEYQDFEKKSKEKELENILSGLSDAQSQHFLDTYGEDDIDIKIKTAKLITSFIPKSPVDSPAPRSNKTDVESKQARFNELQEKIMSNNALDTERSEFRKLRSELYS